MHVCLHAVGIVKDFPGFAQGIEMVGNLAFYQSTTGLSTVSLFLVHTSDPSPAAVARVADLIKAGPGRSAPLLVETTATAFNRDQSIRIWPDPAAAQGVRDDGAIGIRIVIFGA